MNSIKILVSDFDQICRLCLKKTENLISVLTSTNTSSGNKAAVSVEGTMRSCLQIEVKTDDFLPKNICMNCNQILESWSNFKEFCKQSKSILETIAHDHLGITCNKKEEPYGMAVSNDKQNTNELPQLPDIKKKKAGRSIKVIGSAQKKVSKSADLSLSSSYKISKKNERSSDLINEQTLDVEPFHECELCKQKFIHCHNLFDHLRKQHKIGKPYQCQECGKKYSTPTLLSIHEGTHTKPFECDICLRRFANKQSLKAHKLYHEGGEKCEYCGKICTSRVALLIHQRKHTGERPYTCHVCGKMFPYTKNLDLHMRTHNDDFHKDICDVCGYATSIRSNFLKHVRRHNNEKKHLCGSCGKSFVEKCGLNKHLRRHCKGVSIRKRTEKQENPDFLQYLIPC